MDWWRSSPRGCGKRRVERDQRPQMYDSMKTLSIALLLALAACTRPASAPVPPTAAAGSSAELAEPPDPAFIGRVWIATTPGSARGSMLVFLPDRSLLMDSCFETYRISKWGVAGDRIRWLEDTIPIEAEVALHGRNELTLRVAGQEREQTYVAASIPYVCPDMPR